MDASEIDSSKAGALVGTISTLSSKNKIEENPADLSRYGLDNPQVTVTVEKKNGQIDKMIIVVLLIDFSFLSKLQVRLLIRYLFS